MEASYPKAPEGKACIIIKNTMTFLVLVYYVVSFFLIAMILHCKEFGKHIRAHRKTQKLTMTPSSKNSHGYRGVFSVVWPQVRCGWGCVRQPAAVVQVTPPGPPPARCVTPGNTPQFSKSQFSCTKHGDSINITFCVE